MKLKIHLTITLVVLSLSACQLLKKERLSVNQQSQKEKLQVVAQKTTLSQQSELILIDSNHNDFSLIIWPKGKFKFTLTNGFEGEAEKMIVNGKQTQQKLLSVKQKTKRDSSSLKANYSNKKESITTIKKNKLSMGYNWGWVLVLPVIFTLIWVYRRFKR